MASLEAALLEWLRGVGADGIERLEDVLDDDKNETFRAVVADITEADAGSRPSAALERWLRQSGHVYVVDHTDAASVGKAALGAAVHCESKRNYIQKMMALDRDYQASLMQLIEEFNTTVAHGEVVQLRDAVKRLERRLLEASEGKAANDAEAAALAAAAAAAGQGSGAGQSEELVRLHEKNREQEKRIKTLEAQLEGIIEELEDKRHELAQSAQRYEEELEERDSTISAQADELDVARDRSTQLTKAEAKITKLMQKLEETSHLRNELKRLQDENDLSIGRKLEMEAELNSVQSLKQQIEVFKSKSIDLEAQLSKMQKEMARKDEQIAQGTEKLRVATDHSKFLQNQLDECKESIAGLEIELEERSSTRTETVSELTTAHASAQLHATQSASSKLEISQLEEQVAVLKQEKEGLQAALDRAEAQAKERDLAADSDDSLLRQLKEKEAECIKLATDKQKLQAYVKDTLMATQDKYKVALKSLSQQLEEKNEMICNFKAIREEDETTHRLEQRLVMSSFYELGLDIQRRAAMKSTPNHGSNLNKLRQRV